MGGVSVDSLVATVFVWHGVGLGGRNERAWLIFSWLIFVFDLHSFLLLSLTKTVPTDSSYAGISTNGILNNWVRVP